MHNWKLTFAAALVACCAKCQTLAPVDISGFGKDRPIQASVIHVSSSECKAVHLQGDVLSHYDIKLSGTVIFENRSPRAAIFYKNFFVLTERVAAAPNDIASGKFVSGFDADRMAISDTPKKISINDFIVVGPGESYTSTISAIVAASGGSKTPLLHTPGNYWVQLGIDARPDEFYFNPATEKDFMHRWESRGRLVDFIMTKPFSVDIKLDVDAPLCKVG